jgi:hypothetical protein
MALDKITLNPGAGGKDVGVDNIAGTDYEIVKVSFGDAGSMTLAAADNPLPVTDAAAETSLASIDSKLANPLPVTGPLTQAQLLAELDEKFGDLGQAAMASSAPVVIASDQSAIPISAASLPLPTGAATAVNQLTQAQLITELDEKLGDLGQSNMAGSAPVVIASDQTAVPVSGPLTQAQLLAELDEKFSDLGQNLMAASAPVVIASDQSAVPVSGPLTQAQLLLELDEKFSDLGQNAMAASAPVVIASDQSAVPVSGPLTQAQLLVELDEKFGDLGQAAMAASAPVVIASNQSAVPSSVADGSNTVEGAVADAIVAAGATGSLSAKLRRVTQGLEDLKTLIVLAAGTNLIGKAGIDQTTPGTTNGVVLNPVTSGGLTTFHLVSAGSTNATVVKNAAGQLYGWYIYNSNAASRKVSFHNASTTPTAGASIFMSFVIPATSGANVALPIGIAFSTGIAITTTTGLADNDSAAVAANDLIINLWYN